MGFFWWQKVWVSTLVSGEGSLLSYLLLHKSEGLGPFSAALASESSYSFNCLLCNLSFVGNM